MNDDRSTGNLLGKEKSPYLLQHADNPVHWMPWSEEAFRRARKEDKPLLVSIGYSTCHWCHVMERESYEDPETARIMNEKFINVKVDREEHPHVDSLYMKAVQAITGQGGWPLNVFVSPGGTPFFGGTYFPPEDMPGSPSFRTILLNVSRAYYENKGRISDLRETLKSALLGGAAGEREAGGKAEDDVLTHGEETTLDALTRGAELYDGRHGGFGPGMKFPHAMFLEFLLAHYRRTRNAGALTMVKETLHAMARGGIYDHVGGGFHRYTVDEAWRVPHFEKMLYDNALLTGVYAEAFEMEKDEQYARVVEETIGYLLREMRGAEGGFFAAEDADVDGEEGGTYLWGVDEVRAILGTERGEAFMEYFSMTPEGNFGGRNILRIDPAAEEAGLMEQGELAAMKEALLGQRLQRSQPAKDRKIITSWNALVITSLVRAGRALGRKEWLEEAVCTGDFLWSSAWTPDGGPYRYVIDGNTGPGAVLEDGALLGSALVALHEATRDETWLGRAVDLADFLKGCFYDEDSGLFYDSAPTAPGREELFMRERDLFDTDVPSGTAATAGFFWALGRARGNASDKALGVKTLGSITPLDSEYLYHGRALRVLEEMLAEGP